MVFRQYIQFRHSGESRSAACRRVEWRGRHHVAVVPRTKRLLPARQMRRDFKTRPCAVQKHRHFPRHAYRTRCIIPLPSARFFAFWKRDLNYHRQQKSRHRIHRQRIPECLAAGKRHAGDKAQVFIRRKQLRAGDRLFWRGLDTVKFCGGFKRTA